MATAGNLSCALLTLQSKVELHSKTHCTVPHSGFMHFVMVQKKTAIISLNSINRLVFAMGTVSVYRAVRIGFLYISKNSIRYPSPASHRGGPGLIPGHSSGFVWTMWHWDNTSVSPVSIIPSMVHIHLHLHVAFTRRTNGRSLGTFQKAMLFRKSSSSIY